MRSKASQMAIAMLLGSVSSASLATTSFNRINFDLNSASLRADAVAILHEGAELIKKSPDLRVRIEGSACPSETGANALWFERAMAARTFLVQHGVDPRQIVVISVANPKWQESVRAIYASEGPCNEVERAALFEDARVPL